MPISDTHGVRALTREEITQLDVNVRTLIIDELKRLVGKPVMVAVLARVTPIHEVGRKPLIELYGRGFFVLDEMQWLRTVCDNPHIHWQRPEDLIGIDYLQYLDTPKP